MQGFSFYNYSVETWADLILKINKICDAVDIQNIRQCKNFLYYLL